jgi:hypothetical protein
MDEMDEMGEMDEMDKMETRSSVLPAAQRRWGDDPRYTWSGFFSTRAQCFDHNFRRLLKKWRFFIENRCCDQFFCKKTSFVYCKKRHIFRSMFWRFENKKNIPLKIALAYYNARIVDVNSEVVRLMSCMICS